MPRCAAILFVLLAAASPPVAAARERLALVPFHAVVRPQSARAVVMPAMRAALEARGYEVVAGEAVERVLEAERIRYLDSLTPAQLAEVLSALGADAVVLGTILELEPAGDARVALQVKVTSRAGLLWSEVAAVRRSDTGGLLGLSKAKGLEDVVRAACERVVEGLPEGGKLARAVTRPERRGGPRVAWAADLGPEALRVCVLPPVNETSDRRASRVVEAALQDVLARTPGVDVVSPAEMRAGLVAAKVPSFWRVTKDSAAALREKLGTSLFLQTTIFRYEQAPDVELYVSLTNLANGRVVWSGLHRRSGADYEEWFQPGGVSDPALLAERVVAELVGALTDREARRARAPKGGTVR